MANDTDHTQLAQGMKGCITEVDDGGYLAIQLRGLDLTAWVIYEDFRNLVQSSDSDLGVGVGSS